MTQSCTRTLAEFVAQGRYEDLPQEGIEIAKRAILDTLGVAIPGAQEEASSIVCGLVAEDGCREEATIVGTGQRSSALNTAFANGVIFHALDYDDSYYDFTGPTRLHPSSPILAACFSLCEKMGKGGADFLNAFVHGVEVTGAVNRGWGPSHYGRGWHATSTMGIFGVTAAAGKLLGLKTGEVQAAFGIATSLASGSRQNLGTMAKPLHVGHAARCGVLAAQLAARGFTAEQDIFDKPMGLALYGKVGEWDAGRAVSSLANPWAIIQPGLRVKRYPSCGGTHAPLHALFQVLKEHPFKAGEIKHVTVFVPEYPKSLIHPRPRTGLQGKFSLPYCFACGIIDGQVSMTSFTDEAVQRPEFQAFLEKVYLQEKEPPAEEGVKVEVELENGQKYSAEVVHVPGSPQFPLTWQELEEKYRQCVDPYMRQEDVEASVAMIKDFENLGSIDKLVQGMAIRPLR